MPAFTQASPEDRARPALRSAPATSTLELSGTIPPEQEHGYVRVAFTVPPDTARLSVDFHYDRSRSTTLDLGVEDPERLRGWSGGNKSSFTISESDATPSYLPGPIVPGIWHLLIGVASLPPGQGASFTAEVHLTAKGTPGVESFAPIPLRTGARWYRGDLHMHTAQSDGSCPDATGQSVPCPLIRIVEQAAQRHLDFIAITDHNTTSQYNEERELQPLFNNLLLIPGRELTTYAGHANVFGTTSFIDFALPPAERGRMFAEAHALGALVSINHPVAPEGVPCIGCAWQTAGFDMHQADAVEVINGTDEALHNADLAFWQHLLDQHMRLTAIGGSDTHRPFDPRPLSPRVGLPTTVIYATELSPVAILRGLLAGHVFIDVDGAETRSLILTARSTAGQAAMGDILAAPSGQPVTITAQLTGSAGLLLYWLIDGVLQPAVAVSSASPFTTTLRWSALPGPHEIHAIARDATGKLLLLANPIYLNWPAAPEPTQP